ncbi:hypothetical protein QL285_010642 [Trifolium repens]|nr:hypothetical protein QL285_010642 [Trifolium repens]
MNSPMATTAPVQLPVEIMVEILKRLFFDIWETHDNLNWKKLITVSKFGNPRPYHGYLDHYPLCFIQTGELLIFYPDIGLMAYDPKEHRYRRFALLRDARGSQVTVYTDSLVFPPEPLDQTGSSFDQAGSSLGQTEKYDFHPIRCAPMPMPMLHHQMQH